MKAILVNYNYTPTWLLKSDLDWFMHDRSNSKEYLKDFPQERIKYTENIGNVDYDKLTYLVENYDSLPDRFLWGKSNLFKYIYEDEWGEIKDKKEFTPVLTQRHQCYGDAQGPICFYQNHLYFERNNSWYLNVVKPKEVKSWGDWAKIFNLPNPKYIPFAPGGNYILTKGIVHKFPKGFYDKMRKMLGYSRLPGEAQLAERSYYLMWGLK